MLRTIEGPPLSRWSVPRILLVTILPVLLGFVIVTSSLASLPEGDGMLGGNQTGNTTTDASSDVEGNATEPFELPRAAYPGLFLMSTPAFVILYVGYQQTKELQRGIHGNWAILFGLGSIGFYAYPILTVVFPLREGLVYLVPALLLFSAFLLVLYRNMQLLAAIRSAAGLKSDVKIPFAMTLMIGSILLPVLNLAASFLWLSSWNQTHDEVA